MKKRLNLIFEENSKNKLIYFLILLLVIFIVLKKTYIAIFILFIILILLFYKIKNIFKIKKILHRITDNDLKIIEKEIKNPILKNKYNYIITKNFIIKQNMNVAILKYSDIILVYRKLTFNFNTFNSNFIIVDKANNKYNFLLKSSKFCDLDREQFIEKIIKQKNPTTLFGYSKENVSNIKKNITLK